MAKKNNETIPVSILYTSGAKTSMFESSSNSMADLIVLDLEASVEEELKEEARGNIVKFFTNYTSNSKVGIRINPLNTPEGIRDLCFLMDNELPLYTIVMTLVKEPTEVAILRRIMNSSNYSQSKIFVTVETNECIDNITAVTKVADGTILGSADLAAILGVQISWENMLYARQKMIYAAAMFSKLAYDTACFNIHNSQLLESECIKCKDLGFHGKVTIHPCQIESIQKCFSGTKEEIRLAKEILSQQAKAIKVIDGKMIGPPFIKWARTILDRNNIRSNTE